MAVEKRIYSNTDDHVHLKPSQVISEPQKQGDTLNLDSITLPKYYPDEHELTKWMINQMRRRNGLHHLVNFANAHPFILSSYFEVHDQPERYVCEKENSKIPAYSNKTVLFLTPLAMAIYFGCKSVVKVLLNDEVSKLHSRARQHVDVNAICFARRIKPKQGIFGMEDYFTTTAPMLAIRRTFFPGLTLLINAGFKPEDRVTHVDHVASKEQRSYKSTDLVDYTIRLMISRPGFDVIGLLQTIMHSGYDVMAYDVYSSNRSNVQTPVWFSLFRRVCRRGINPIYVNCANRLIDILEVLQNLGFFKQDIMPHGPVGYEVGLGRSPAKRGQIHKRLSSDSIRAIEETRANEAQQAMAIDRDECFAFLTIWLNKMRTRCLKKPSQRLTKLLLSAMADTDMLMEFLLPPSGVDTQEVLWPKWIELGTGLNQQLPNTNWKSCQEEINIFSEDTDSSYALEPTQLNDLRQDLRRIALLKRLVSHETLENYHRSTLPKSTEVKEPPRPPVPSRSNVKPDSRALTAVFSTEVGILPEEKQYPTTQWPNNIPLDKINSEFVPRAQTMTAESESARFSRHAVIEDLVESNFNNSESLRSKTAKIPDVQSMPVKPRPKTAKSRSPAPKMVPQKAKRRRPKTADPARPGQIGAKPPARWRI